MKTTCRVVRSLAPSAEVAALAGRIDGHIAFCLSCQAEMARYGKLRRQLASLADVVVEAPEPLAAAVELAISAGGTSPSSAARQSHPARVAAAAGAVIAAAAGAVAVVLWRHSKAAA
jgi:anti-sigma factor RsiW